MKVTINNVLLEVHEGAVVKDAIIGYYTHTGRPQPKQLPQAEDRFGNIVAPDGELTENSVLFINPQNNKRGARLKISLLLLPLLLLHSCSSFKPGTTPPPDSREAVIFAVNDMHASLENFPKLAWIVDSLRALYPDLLLVSAGDNQTGDPTNDQYPQKGIPMIELMNATGFILSAVGNHEFDSRPEGFAYQTRKADFSFLSANISADSSLHIRLLPHKRFFLPNGLRLTFFGLTQVSNRGIPDTHPDNTKGFAFRDPLETAPGSLHLKDSSDILIALTHIGFENDVRLAETLPSGVDLIIGGHSHTRVEKEQIHNGIMITQAEARLKYGTLIRLSVSDNGIIQRQMQLIEVSDSGHENPLIRAMVDKFNDNPVLAMAVTIASDDFSSVEELGYLMADAQRYAAHADIALMNPGGVRIDKLAKGVITARNIYQLDPFGNELIVFNLTGDEIYALMEAAWPVDGGTPLLASGITLSVKPDRQGRGERFTILTEKGLPLKRSHTYRVAMNSYMAQVYKYDHTDPGESLFITTAQSLTDYLKRRETVRSYRGERRVEIIME